MRLRICAPTEEIAFGKQIRPEPRKQPAPVEPQSEQAIGADADADADLGDLIVDAGVAVSPEQSSEEHERSDLDP